MQIIESKSPRVDYSHAVVRITKRPTLAESPVRYNKITVIATPADSEHIIDATTGGMAIMGESIGDLSPYVAMEELGEIRNFVGTIRLHNDLDNLDEVYRQAKMWGVSLIYTSGATAHVLAENLPLPNDSLYCWLTHSEETIGEGSIALVAKNNIGLMINLARDERLLYAISRMVQFVGRVVPTNAIVNDNMAGLVYLEQVDYFAENGISFWLKTVQKSYPFSLFLGKIQAYIKYYDAIIEHEVREAVAGFISDGYTMGQLDILGNTITTALARFIDQLDEDLSIEIPSLASMSEANQRAGIIDFVEIRYNIFGEIRQVNITL